MKFFENIDIEKLNMLHWVIFFDYSNILKKLLQKSENIEEQFHLG